MFLVGHRSDSPFLFPEPLFGPDSSCHLPHVTAGEALSNLANFETLEPLILRDGKYAHLLPLVPPGDNYLFFTARRGYPKPIFAYRSRFSDFLYKANPHAPIKTLIARPGKYTGPFHWDNRKFTIQESARLQGFPDNYSFSGSREEVIRQIGNSVSPRISYVLALAVAQQIFGIDHSLRLLHEDKSLTFDKRKGEKARQTRALHLEVAKKRDQAPSAFSLESYSTLTEPTVDKAKPNTRVRRLAKDHVRIEVGTDSSRKLYAEMQLVIHGAPNDLFVETRPSQLKVDVIGYGKTDTTIQAMWNAVDAWVIKSSNYHSLFELYGHFTEPHPVFSIAKFRSPIRHPVAKFAKHCADFSNCSVHLPCSHLTSLFNVPNTRDNFLSLVVLLRGYRFDIRCFETNVTMPRNRYLVAYPFTLPTRRQMNFSVQRDRGDAEKSSETIAAA
jgi:DNA (cytosine-5)-methyltransferase 1